MVLLSVFATTALARPAGDSAADTPATEPEASSAPPSGAACSPNGGPCSYTAGLLCCTGACSRPAGGVSGLCRWYMYYEPDYITTICFFSSSIASAKMRP
jgi:hypothetical protein